MKKHLLRAAPLLLGALLLAYLLHSVGLTDVLTRVRSIGWNALLILPVSAIWKCSSTVSWALSYPPDAKRPRLLQLFRANLAGDVVTHLLPMGNLGGEVAKPFLLAGLADRSITASAVVATKTMEILSGILLASAGVVTALFVLPIDQNVRLGLAGALLAASLAVFLIYRFQKRGPFATIFAFLSKAGFLERRLAGRAGAAGRVDSALSDFYHSSNRWRALASLGLRAISWLLGTTETYLIMRAMGADVTFLDAFLLVSLALLIDVAFTFVPGGVGTFEAGHTYLAFLLGLDPAIGLAAAVAKRGRRLFWMAVGIVALQGKFRKLLTGNVGAAPPGSTPGT